MVAMWSFGSSGSNGNSLDLCTKYRDEPAERWWQTANVNQFFVPPLLRYVQELGCEWNSVTMMLTRVWKLWLADKQQQQGAQDPEEGVFFLPFTAWFMPYSCSFHRLGVATCIAPHRLAFLDSSTTFAYACWNKCHKRFSFSFFHWPTTAYTIFKRTEKCISLFKLPDFILSNGHGFFICLEN